MSHLHPSAQAAASAPGHGVHGFRALFSRCLSWTLFSLCFTCHSVQAQSHKELKVYFEKYLNNEPATKPGRSFSVKQLKERRDMVWAAWRAANLAAQSPTPLPAPCTVEAPVSHAWQLPDSLEPQATMPFYFATKGERPQAGFPLFLYLHGSGPKAQEWATGLVLAGRFEDAPSAYFIPQIPNEGGWYRWWQRSKQFAWESLFRGALLRDDIDPARLYLFGISEGGYGSQRLASFYADYLAAAGPMAGGEPLKNAPAENLSNIGFSLRTGANDKGFYRDYLTRLTAEALDSLEELYPAGYRHNVQLIEGRGHHIDYSPTTPWLSHFKRNATPRHFIWEDFEMDGRHRAGFYNLLSAERPDRPRRTRYDVDIADNVVNIAVENVTYTCIERDPQFGIELRFRRTYEEAQHGEITVFLDENLVDLLRPVIINVNGRRMLKAKPTLSTASLVEAVCAFGDPLRLFPASFKVKW